MQEGTDHAEEARERAWLGLLVRAGCQVCIMAPGGLACLPYTQGETAALCRASRAVVSGAAQFRCAEGGACPQINESGAKIPFNILCQVLSRIKL